MEESIYDFLSDLRANKAYAENTLSAYQVDLGQFFNFVSLTRPNLASWGRVEKSLLQEYVLHLRERGYSQSSIARKVAALKSFFYYLQQRGITVSNPALSLDSPRVKRSEPRALAPEDLERLLQSAEHDRSPKGLRDRALLYVLAAAGLRASELVALYLGDVKPETRGLACRGPGAHARELALGERAWTALVEYLELGRPQLQVKEGQEPLFVNMQGERLTRQGLWLIVKGYVKAAGIEQPVTPYTLRHSFAMQLLREGQNLAHIQKSLGHSHKTTTQKYNLTRSSENPNPGPVAPAPGGGEADGEELPR